MRVLLAALLLGISTPAFADNIAGCEIVLMEKIQQEGVDGSAEVASFRPAADFIASVYDDETDVVREIDGLPIRAIMCKRSSVVPSLRDFPIVATGTPFMISQNFDSTESGLTTIYFQGGEFRSDYKGPELDETTATLMKDRLDVFNLQPHDLAEKEKAMLAKLEGEAVEDEVIEEQDAEDAVAEELLTEEVVAEEAVAEEMLTEEIIAEELLSEELDVEESALQIDDPLLNEAKTELEETTNKLGIEDDMLGESLEDEAASARKTLKFDAPEELKKEK